MLKKIFKLEFFTLIVAILATGFIAPSQAQVDVKLRTVIGNTELSEVSEWGGYIVQYDRRSCNTDNCVLSVDSSQISWWNNWGAAYIGAVNAQKLSVAGQMRRTEHADGWLNLVGGARSDYSVNMYADAAPGANLRIKFTDNLSIAWSMPGTEVTGDIQFTFRSSTGAASSGYAAVNQVFKSSTTSEAKSWTAGSIVSASSSIEEETTTYYYVGNFHTLGRLTVKSPYSGVSSGSYYCSIDNIEAHYIGKTLKKMPDGDNQTWLVTQPLPKGLTVRVVDGETGLPAANEPVSFAVLAPVNGAELSATSINTDLDGYATTYLTLGASTGTYRVRATCPGCVTGVKVTTFTATAKATELLKISGDGVMPVDKQALNPLKIQALNPITTTGEPGHEVNFSIVSVPAGGGAANIWAPRVITNEFGIASSSFTLGESEGDYIVKARCENCQGNKEVFFTVNGSAPVEDAHPSVEGEKTAFTPPPPDEIGALVITFQNRHMRPNNQFKAVTRADSRIGILSDVDPTITFSGSVAPPPNPPLIKDDYKWSGASGELTGKTINVTFPSAGEFTQTLTVRNKSRTVRITVAAIGPAGIGFFPWLLENPTSAPIVLSCAINAATLSQTFYGNPDPPNLGNAVKHSYWNACITNLINSMAANEVTTAFERTGMNEPGMLENETIMDLENNADGRVIGEQLPYLIGQPLILGEIMNAAQSGTLTVLDAPYGNKAAGLLQPSY